MVLVTGGSPWKRPRRGSRRGLQGHVRRMTDSIGRIDALGPDDFTRIAFVRALRRLLRRDPWDGPPSAA